MRLKITFANPQEACLPVNYQHLLTGAVYHLLEASDADYSRFLHEQGYALDGGPKRFKLFVFSWLRPASRKGLRVEGGRLWLAPGPVAWYLSSPVEAFLTHSATGLLASGRLQLGAASLAIAQVEALPAPDFSGGVVRFTCLSPIVASVPGPEGGTRYLRPAETEEFSEAVRRNLVRKYELLYGRPPKDDRLTLTFDRAYLARDPHGGTKKMTFKDIDIVAAYVPFILTGSPELMQTAWNCGLGEKNSGGFGMVEVAK
ncbi:MAG TPA: CRISPR-associated endoribonuclease Cas6 [Chthonomonadaceae bacterium]|nr:CRISPR-associated endoribonuclease Cas6 [Chthonomonadaceae bacterium]